MIGQAEWPHRWPDPLLQVMDEGERRRPLERPGAQGIHYARVVVGQREVDGVGADRRELPGRHTQAPVFAEEERPVT